MNNTEKWIAWYRAASDWDKGDFGERLWSAVIAGSGLSYIRLSKLCEGGAPMQKGSTPLVLPDLEANSPALSVYVDSKLKTGPVCYRNAGNEWRHGIDRKSHDNYERISAYNRKHCCLGVFEVFADASNPKVWSGALLFNSLAKLGRPISGMGSQPHMVYWPRSKFVQLGTVSADELIEITYAHGAAIRFADRLLECLEIIADKPVQRFMFA